MGEVYKARDTRLDRTVAIKVLPAHLASDAQFRQRFDREARAVGALNHPHICTLHDVGHQDGTDYLVLEFLEGETLAERLAKGALPLDQALRYASEIADALDKAHRAGVTHRDLKPGNVMLTKSGSKLLDFGLAKARGASSVRLQPDQGLSALPTEQHLTAQGTILGTFQYMAPEQVEGHEADARTDIFAFGTVLYEMLTGKKAFTGSSSASIIAAILERPAPSVTAVAPASLDRVMQRCLAKEPDERWQSARDLKAALDVVALPEASAGRVVPSRSPWRERAAWAGAVVAAVGAVWYFGVSSIPAPAASSAARFSILPPVRTTFVGPIDITVPVPQFALAPDGSAVAFVAAAAGGKSMLWIRPIAEIDALAIPGTEDLSNPFWSSDSRSLAFVSAGRLKKVAVEGGPPQVVADRVASFRGGSWGPDGTILFASQGGTIERVSSAGGNASPVTQLDTARQEGSHRFPYFLPDGRHFLYTVRSPLAEQRGVYVGSIDDEIKKRLFSDLNNAVYSSAGYLLFLDGQTLRGQAFDAERLELNGPPFTIAADVGVSSSGLGAFSVSGAGVLAYSGTLSKFSRLTWFDRSGREAGTIGATPALTNAVVDALAPFGVKHVDMPAKRERIWRLMQQAGR